MKLYIDYAPVDCGKYKFLQRLCEELFRHGVSTTSNPSSADVAMLVPRLRGRRPSCPTVIRMDGIDFLDTEHNRKKLAEVILPSIKMCDAIIYQSEFCRDAIRSVLPEDVILERQYVIFNGANPEEFAVVPPSRGRVHNVLLAARWFDQRERRYKRLDELLEFIRGYVARRTGTHFWIAGRTNPAKEYSSSKGVTFLGELSNDALLPYLRMARTYLHMPEFSWCDNSLVEAICAGCLPLGSNLGGNAEVIRAVGGIIVSGDLPREFGFVSNYIPTPIEEGAVEMALDAANGHSTIDLWPIHISNVAMQYLSVFNDVLNIARR